MTEILTFAGMPLDRAEKERRSERWILDQLERDESRFLPYWRLQVLVKEGDAAGLAWARGQVRDIARERVGAVLLGQSEGVAHFAVDVSDVEDPVAELGVEGMARFEDVRAAAARLPAGEAAVAGQGRALVDWHARHGYCAVCGEATRSRSGGGQRVCTECDAEHFPRTDPVVIAVVARDDRCLLGRQRGWPAGMYSALAGFVETGECIEEAVRREVHEESGVEVGAVRYVASQPWPFPSSLMIGCIAQAETQELHIDPVELEDARWFERGVVQRALAGDADAGFWVPPPQAIAHFLMRAWADGEDAAAG